MRSCFARARAGSRSSSLWTPQQLVPALRPLVQGAALQGRRALTGLLLQGEAGGQAALVAEEVPPNRVGKDAEEVVTQLLGDLLQAGHCREHLVRLCAQHVRLGVGERGVYLSQFHALGLIGEYLLGGAQVYQCAGVVCAASRVGETGSRTQASPRRRNPVARTVVQGARALVTLDAGRDVEAASAVEGAKAL